MRMLILTLAVLAGVAAPMAANAGYCTTTCHGSGNYRTCNTWCY